MVDRTIDETLTAVQAEDAGADSLIAYTQDLKRQLLDALSSVKLPAEVQAKVNQVFDISSATASKLNSAIQTDGGAGGG